MTLDNYMKKQVRCPKCDRAGLTKVTRTKEIQGATQTLIERYHICKGCGAKYSTINYQAPTFTNRYENETLKKEESLKEAIRREADKPTIKLFQPRQQVIDAQGAMSDDEAMEVLARWCGEGKSEAIAAQKALKQKSIFEEVTLD